MTDYKGLTLTKAQVKEIAKHDWIALNEPTFIGNDFLHRGGNVSVTMCESNKQFNDHVNSDNSIDGADFLVVAYRPIKG